MRFIQTIYSFGRLIFLLIFVLLALSCSEGDENFKSYNLLSELNKTENASKFKVSNDTIKGQRREVIYVPASEKIKFKNIKLRQNSVFAARYGLKSSNPYKSNTRINFYVEIIDKSGNTQRVLENSIALNGNRQKNWYLFKTNLDFHLHGTVDIVLGTEYVSGNSESVTAVWSNVEVLNTPVDNSRPNIILVSLDALRADKLSCYGYRNKTSPNIDQFAENSVLYKRAHSTATWSLPSHASMLTGLYPSQHRAISAVPPEGKEATAANSLPESIETLPEVLSRKGYYTSAFVSLPYLQRVWNINQGFLLYNDLVNGRTAEDVTSLILDNLKVHNNTPFFLFAHYREPHAPYYPSDPEFRSDLPPEFGRFDIRKLLPTKIVQDKLPKPTAYEKKEIVKRYESNIRYVDSQIGRLLRGLKRLNLMEETLVIITSDHGECFGEYDYWSHGGKPYPELTRVPLIVSYPGKDSGKKIEEPVSLVSLRSAITKFARIAAGSPGGKDSNATTDNQFLKKGNAYAEVFDKNGSTRSFSINDYYYMRSIKWTGSEKNVEKSLWENQSSVENQKVPKNIREKYRNFLERNNLSEKEKAIRLKTSKNLDKKTRDALKALGYLD